MKTRSLGPGTLLSCVGAGFLALLFLGSVTTLSQRPPTVDEVNAARQWVRDQRALGSVDNTWMPVGRGSAGRWILGDGFSHPEVDGAWITNEVARLELLTDPALTPASVAIRLLANTGPLKPSRNVHLYTSIDEVRLEATGNVQEITLALDGSPSSQVTIKCDTLDSPSSIGAGLDLRELCAKVLAIKVTYDSN